MKTHHWVTLGAVLMAVALLGGILLRLQGSGEEEGGAAAGGSGADSVRAEVRSTAAGEAFATEIAVPVEGAVVRRDTFVMWISASGTAAPVRRSALHAEVDGPVVEVPVREGRAVSAGQLLVKVDPTPYEIAVREARAAVEAARAEFQDLTLFDDDIPDEQVRRERREAARYRSGLAGAEAQLARAEYDLTKTEIRAPFAGRVANLAVSPGSRVRQGDSVAVVLDLSRVDVEAEVIHTEVPHLRVDRPARATFPALPGETFTGRVYTVNPLIREQSRTARVTVRLGNPEARILPGMPGNVEIAGRMLEGRTFLPREAIVEREGGGERRDVVFLFEPSEPGSATGRAQWTYVTRGLESEEFVEIVPADETVVPEAGAIVLVDGHVTLTHDARVRIENHEAIAGEARETSEAGSR